MSMSPDDSIADSGLNHHKAKADADEVVEVVDHTHDPDAGEDPLGEEAPHVRLQGGGINVRELLEQRDGVLFEPEIDEDLFRKPPAPEDRSYFAAAAADKDLEEKLAQMHLDLRGKAGDDGDTGSDEEEDTFEARARRMADVTEDGLVKKRVVFRGHRASGHPPARGTVTIHYSFYFEHNDEPFDSTTLRGRAERFRLDDGRMILGVESAVKSMLKGEESWFLIGWEYAYGPMGCPPRIPAKAPVLAKIKLLDFAAETDADALLALEPEERSKKKNYDEIEKIVRVEHVEGNGLIKKEEYKGAARRYTRGIRLLEDVELRNDQDEKQQKHLVFKLYLNRSYCFIKVHMPKKACLDLQKALEMQPYNAKALYRMGIAKRQLGSYSDAKSYLLRANQASPGDTDIGSELASLDEMMRKREQNERELCKRMFPGAQMPRQERNPGEEVDDETRSEMMEQIKGFKESSQRTLPLPASLGTPEIFALKSVCEELDMKMQEIRRGTGSYWEIHKK